MNQTMKYTVHALHDLSGAVWFGGNLFGVVALNSGVRAAHDHRERGAVLNQSWENFAPYGAISALTLGATWAAMRVSDRRLASKESLPITRVRDWLTIGAIASTAAGGVLNRMIAESAPDDRVPVEGGTDPAAETPEPAAGALVAMRLVAASNLLLGGALLATGSVLEQQQMDAGVRLNELLPLSRRAPVLNAVKTLAAAELLRRGGKLLGESIDALRPHEPTTADRLKGGALDLFQRASELIGDASESLRPSKADPLSRVAASLADTLEYTGDLIGKGMQTIRPRRRSRWQRVAQTVGGVFGS